MRRARVCIVLSLALVAAQNSARAQGSLPAVFAKKVPESVRDLQDIENHTQKLVERVLPATVCLRIGNAYGSGVIIDREGHILTAGHVSGAANRDATVIMPDGKRLRGKTLGANNGIDSGMVVIIDRADFPHLDMARSTDLRRGQWCLALGHPGGYKPGRPPVVRLGRIQIADGTAILSDCVLVGGDSGGPLFDMNGRVIGIHSRIGANVTANVHVPIDTYRDTWAKLAAGEVWGSPGPLFNAARPAQPYLGLSAGADKMLLKISAVTPGSPADKAGLKANDIILKIDNLPIASADDLADVLAARMPGARLNIQVQRGGDIIILPVVLGKREN
jgi:serine protease Do